MSSYDDPRDEEIGPYNSQMCRAGRCDWCDDLGCECGCHEEPDAPKA